MGLFRNYHLREIIDIKSLEDIQDKFSKITGLSTVTVDENGNPIGKSSNFSKFCNIIRSSPEGKKRCFQCDAKGAFSAMKRQKPVIYNCHCGLTDLAAPIIVNDNYIGGMLCGQVIIKEANTKNKINIQKISKELCISKELLQNALDEVNILNYEDINDAANYLFLFANFIAKMGVTDIEHNKLLKEINEKMTLEKLLKNTQIKALQSQINPHFLFNTLNTVARMALLENAPKTEELIYHLSDILRYSLKNSKNLVTIEDEINNIKKYLFIQKLRFGDIISYSINIDKKILKCKIPVMSLQPIVENSIIHGLECIKEPGNIYINGILDSDHLVSINIYDNGIGIDGEKLANINLVNCDMDSVETGLQNVRNRIKHYFGHTSQLIVYSKKNEGTKVSIKIPYTFS